MRRTVCYIGMIDNQKPLAYAFFYLNCRETEMKNFLVLLCVVCVFFPGCEKKEPALTGPMNPTPVVTTSESEVSIIVSAGAYTEAKSDAGETYIKFLQWVQPDDAKVTLLQGETKSTKVFDYDKAWREVPLAPARIGGANVFVSMHYILPNQRVVVVKSQETATVYNGLKIKNITDFTLPRGTIIAVAPVTGEQNDLNLFRFVAYQVPQVSGKKESFGTWANFFVEESEFSTDEKDLEMVKLLKSMDAKSPSQWPKMVEKAAGLYPDSPFLEDARRKINAATGSEEDMQEESYQAEATVNAADVLYRKAPTAADASNIKGKLTQYDRVSISAKTSGQFTIAGTTAPWYKISTTDGKEGWVFGKYLTIE
jgi:hypothetical protein